MNKFPKLTIVVPVFNEEKNIVRCLTSIFNQKYPRNRLEVIVVDDISEDNTVREAKRFPVNILRNDAHDGEVGKMIGFNAAKGDLFYYLDADVELRGNDWITKMIYPLISNKNIVGVFTRHYAKRNASSLERYYSMEALQRDAVYEFFSPSVESTVSEKNDDYEICEFAVERIPSAGRCLYRRQMLKKIIGDSKKYLELDIMKLFVKRGYTKFAYVPQAGIYHHHVESLSQLIEKRKRNVQKVYLPDIENREYTWFSLTNPGDLIKLFLLFFYAHTLVFSLIRGIYKCFKYKDIAGLWEPIVTLVTTDIIIFSFISNAKGLQFIFRTYFGKFIKK